MKSKIPTPEHASPSGLPPPPWQAKERSPGIAHVVTDDDTLLAVVIDHVGPLGTALRAAERMAAAPCAIRLLGQLRAAILTGTARDIDAACAAADALLGRLGEP